MRTANTKYQRHRLVFGSRNWHTSPFYEQKHSCGVLRKSHLTAKQYLIKPAVVSNINVSIYIILMHIHLYIFEPVYHCLNQEQERSVRLADIRHATSLDWSGCTLFVTILLVNCLYCFAIEVYSELGVSIYLFLLFLCWILKLLRQCNISWDPGTASTAWYFLFFILLIYLCAYFVRLPNRLRMYQVPLIGQRNETYPGTVA